MTARRPLSSFADLWRRLRGTSAQAKLQRSAAESHGAGSSVPQSLSWLKRLRHPKTQQPQSSDNMLVDVLTALPSQTLRVGSNEFAFGLKWLLVEDRKEIDKALKEAATQGYTHYILASGQMLGLAKLPSGSKKPMSAAVHLAESTSLGGQELFVFELRDQLHALIALNDNLPLSHFDQTGDPEHVMALVQEFLGLYPGQSLRTVGNVPVASNIEALSPKEAFARGDSAALLKPIPNYKFRILMLVLVLPFMLAFAAGAGWLHWQHQKAEEERIAREQDPNYIYENAVPAALQNVAPQAQSSLDQWRQAINHLPMAQAGWVLKKVSCERLRCQTTWEREYGSYEDFYAQTSIKWESINKVQTGDNPAKATIDAVMALPATPTVDPAGLKRNTLQPMADTLKEVASVLQDLSLIPRSAVTLKSSELYPATGAQIEQIQMPVVKGEWSIQHDLWSLGQLKLTHPHMTLQNLSVTQDEKTQQWIYALTGHYYAKGKNY